MTGIFSGSFSVFDAAKQHRERMAELNRREREAQLTLQREMEKEMADIRNQDVGAIPQTPSDYVRSRCEQDLKVFEESRNNLNANIADFQKQLANTETAIAATRAALNTLDPKAEGPTVKPSSINK